MVTKINVSISKDILEKLDEAASEAKTSRSGFIAEAVEHYLREREEERLLRRRKEAAESIDRFREKYGGWDGAAEVLKWRDRH